MSTSRLELVRSSFERKAVEVETPEVPASAYFGELVFDRAKMRKYLEPNVLKALLSCIEGGEALDRQTADGVARGMKEWALEHHVTLVTHWFNP